ncbi:MAG: hypothetical protein OJF50_006672 [Nitrospira sp.]|nr:hypothetical protein [Nitrospira sp.]
MGGADQTLSERKFCHSLGAFSYPPSQKTNRTKITHTAENAAMKAPEESMMLLWCGTLSATSA